MMELTEKNAIAYLRQRGSISPEGEVLVQSLSGGVANVVLKIMDMNAGEPVGTDMRTVAQIKRGLPDKRMRSGACFVLKQPLAEFRTAANWLVDRDRVWVERDALMMLREILPVDTIPTVLWDDPENYILAISVAPVGVVNWKKQLLTGQVDRRAAEAAAGILAMLHATTAGDVKWAQRFGDSRGFVQQRIDPYLRFSGDKNKSVAPALRQVESLLLGSPMCLIHGDYSPKNMLWRAPADGQTAHWFILDFEVAFYGNPAFDVATLLNHLLLKAFYFGKRWRAAMIAADYFWQTYRETAPKPLVAEVSNRGGKILAALLLARIDGKSPVEYITDEQLKARIRACAVELLLSGDESMDAAIDHIAGYLDQDAPAKSGA
jgi:hypothetical protein